MGSCRVAVRPRSVLTTSCLDSGLHADLPPLRMRSKRTNAFTRALGPQQTTSTHAVFHLTLRSLPSDGRMITESDVILEQLEAAFGPLGYPMRSSPGNSYSMKSNNSYYISSHHSYTMHSSNIIVIINHMCVYILYAKSRGSETDRRRP